MVRVLGKAVGKLKEKRAQILLPAVMLVPIFILVIYLLFETAKVSMSKVRQQFALDNAAYSQMSATSTYLNSVALLNGPLPYRVLLQMYQDQNLTPKPGEQPVSIFELFYHGGGVPSIGPDYKTGINRPPRAESVDWGVHYDPSNKEYSRADWEKEFPKSPGSDPVPVMSKEIAETHYLPARGLLIPVIQNYLETFVRVGSIYDSQTYTYEQVNKNALMFREAYYLNSNDCEKAECGRQSAAQLRQFLTLKMVPVKLEKARFYFTESERVGSHGGAYELDLTMSELNLPPLFQFAHLSNSSVSKLRPLSRGIKLKQPFKLPRNYFNINLEQKYKPYVHTTVTLSCPRGNNNCVWPNPLPKYNITLDP